MQTGFSFKLILDTTGSIATRRKSDFSIRASTLLIGAISATFQHEGKSLVSMNVLCKLMMKSIFLAQISTLDSVLEFHQGQ